MKHISLFANDPADKRPTYITLYYIIFYYDIWSQGKHECYWQLTFSVKLVVACRCCFCCWLIDRALSTNRISEQINILAGPLTCIYDKKLISDHGRQAASQWVSFSLGHWFLTEFIRLTARCVSAHHTDGQHCYHMLNCPQHTLSLPLILLFIIAELEEQRESKTNSAHDGCCSSLQGGKNNKITDKCCSSWTCIHCCTISLVPSGRAKNYFIYYPSPTHWAARPLRSEPCSNFFTLSSMHLQSHSLSIVYCYIYTHTSIHPARVHQAIIHQQGTDGVTDR